MNIAATKKKCRSLLKRGQHRKALKLARKLSENQPDVLDGHLLYAQLLFSSQQFDESLKVLELAHQLAPESAEVLSLMGQAAQELGQVKDCLELYSRALELEPTAQRMVLCGNFLLEIGHLTEAELLLASAANQGSLSAVAGLVHLMMRQNRFPEAADLVSAHIQQLADEPALVHACARLLLSQQDAAGALEALSMLIAAKLPYGSRVVHFRLLGETQDKLGNREKAFRSFEQFNQLRGCSYVAEQHTQLIASVIERYKDTSSFTMLSACQSSRPVFVVGMPRSGTSLLEQVLSMHPEVYAAGELDHIPGLISEHGVESVEALDQIASIYLQRIEALDSQAKVVTDKLPHNYLHLGELARIFPNARVIYCRRDPVDTGWSCYRQNFHSSLSFATDLWSIGHFQARLQELMSHWQRVLPLPILEVSYEELVADLQAISRQVLDHCGLDWNPAVLDFHRSDRVVHTASSQQVRQPLYSSSIGAAEGYAEFLNPLRQGLES